MEKKIQNEVKISIGLPVHNGEKFIKKKLDSLFAQTFSDFELIISDNGSTDSTKQICTEFATNDKRIRFFSHTKNMGPTWNFNFILEKARGKYFMWTAVDDIILSGFIEKNLKTLQNEEIVCSVSQVQYYGEKTNKLKQENTNRLLEKIKEKIFQHFSPLRNIPVSGKLDVKIRKYLQIRGHHHVFYGIYRTKEIKKIFVSKGFSGFDLATILNSLRFGNIHVNDDVLMYRYDGGDSSKGFFSYKKSLELSFFQALFHLMPFTNWFIGNFGIIKFLKNLDSFIIWNLEGFFYLGIDVVRKIGFSKRGYN